MAALAQDYNLMTYPQNSIFGGHICRMDVIASDIVYRGSFVLLGTNGVGPCGTTDATAAYGIALETVDNSAGAAGAKQVDVLVGGTFVIPTIANATDESQIGEPVYTTTDNPADLDMTAITDCFVGNIIGYKGGAQNEFIVKMNPVYPVGNFTITNFVEDYDMDADGLVGVVADTLATLIVELSNQGIIRSTVTA